MQIRANLLVWSLIPCAVLLACYRGAGPSTRDQTKASAAPIAAGIYGCHFVLDGTPYGEHRCDVRNGSLNKQSGMETFRGTLAVGADGVKLNAKLDCGDMATACGKTFSVTLRHEGASWRGQVAAAPDAADWFLAGATFELSEAAGYGGDVYVGNE